MKSTLTKFRTFAIIVFSLANLFCANTVIGQASLSSDLPDYAPGTTATFTGIGFNANELITILVLHYDGTSDGGADHQPWEVTADSDGNFVTTWHVCEDDCVGSTLRATADGQSSALHADVIFTDAITISPDGIGINSTTDQARCIGTAASALTATIITCQQGGGPQAPTQTPITYKWYYNATATNNINTATLVSTFSTTTATTSNSFTPLTTSAEAGTVRYYFCQLTFIAGNGNACGGSGRTGYPYTTQTDKVTVNNLPVALGIPTPPLCFGNNGTVTSNCLITSSHINTVLYDKPS